MLIVVLLANFLMIMVMRDETNFMSSSHIDEYASSDDTMPLEDFPFALALVDWYDEYLDWKEEGLSLTVY